MMITGYDDDYIHYYELSMHSAWMGCRENRVDGTESMRAVPDNRPIKTGQWFLEEPPALLGVRIT